MITAELLADFKSRMRIFHDTEDDNLEWLLESSYRVIQARCGAFDITESVEGKELVFERARYAYHDSVEYFEENFLTQLHSFGMSQVVIDDETV